MTFRLWRCLTFSSEVFSYHSLSQCLLFIIFRCSAHGQPNPRIMWTKTVTNYFINAFHRQKIGLNNSFLKCIVNSCTPQMECFGCYKMFEICFCPNTFFVVDKRSSFPSKAECHLSFIIDIRPIFYYSLPHK